MKFANRWKGLLILTLISIISISFSAPPAQGYVMKEYVVLGEAQPLDIDPKPLNIIIASHTGTSTNQYVYFTEQLGGVIGRIDISAAEPWTMEEWASPSDPIEGHSEPWDLVNSTDAIFYTDYHLNRIYRLHPASGTFNWWEIPTDGAGPTGIAYKSDTELWFTEYSAGKIAYFNPTTDTFLEYPLPSGSHPMDIMVLGNDVWWTDYSRNRIGVLTGYGTTEIIKEYKLLSGSRPYGLTSDPDGNIWFTCSGRNVIAEFNPLSRQVIEHKSIPTTGSQPRKIAVDPRTREVWVTEHAGHKIVKYVPGENLFVEYPTLTPGSAPSGIALLPGSKKVFFTEWSGNRIGLLEEGDPAETYGTTTTITATKVTSAVTGKFRATTTKTTVTREEVPPTTGGTGILSEANSIAGTNTTGTTLTGTAYKLSTSTMGTSISYIEEVIYTTTTSTSISTTYVATVSQTSTNVSVSTSTSYIDTTLITYSTTQYATLYTGTMSMTSTSTLAVPNTATVTLTSTKYKSTTSATTTVSSTAQVQGVQTQTQYTTITTTIPATETITPGTTTVTTLPNISLPCIIASAAYESELSPAVQYLRDFRESYVKATYAGSRFMEVFNAWYYSFSPTVASYVSNSLAAKTAVKALLYPLFGVLEAAATTYHAFGFNPELGITLAGVLASGLIGLIYTAPLAVFVQYNVWRRWRFKLKLGHLKPLLYIWISSIIGIGLAELFRWSTVMRASTATLVLSSMVGSALLVSTMIFRKIGEKR